MRPDVGQTSKHMDVNVYLLSFEQKEYLVSKIKCSFY